MHGARHSAFVTLKELDGGICHGLYDRKSVGFGTEDFVHYGLGQSTGAQAALKGALQLCSGHLLDPTLPRTATLSA